MLLEKHGKTPVSCNPHPLPCVLGLPVLYCYHLLPAQRALISSPACSTSVRGSHPAQQHLFSGKWKRKGKRHGSGMAADRGMEREIEAEMRPHVASSYPG